MAALTRSWPCWTLMFVAVATASTFADQKIITAESGQNITLTCRAPNNNITVVEWSRADLEPEYVFVYRNEKPDPENQHPSFKNRVDLQDRQMKDGDVSLILKDETINDTGTYECRVFTGETRSWELISIIYLSVDPPGPPRGSREAGGNEGGEKEGGGREDGSVGLIVGLIVFVLVLFAFIAWMTYKFFTCKKKNSHNLPPPDQEAGQMLA